MDNVLALYYKENMKVGALFAGIGGLELGFEQAGHKTIFSCEIWDPAIAVLRNRFRGVPNRPDIRKLRSLPSDIDLLTAGFPCQDLSQAGMTAGIAGKRSGLVDHVFRLLDRRRIPVVVLENVSFMLQLDKGAAMNSLTTAFEERGYRWAYRTVNSLAFLPQRRERVFFVASACDLEPEKVLFSDEVHPVLPATKLGAKAHGFYWTEGIRGLGWAPDAVPTLKNGSTVGIPSPPAIFLPSGKVIKPDIRDAERLQGFPEDWTKPAEEVTRASLRWSLVGNAVSVPVAAWLGRRLSEPGFYFGDLDTSWPSKTAWPKAARYDGRRRIAVSIGMYPVWKKRQPLHKFLHYEGALLSAKATAGFLSRTERASLRFPVGFLDALRAHLRKVQGCNLEPRVRAPTKSRKALPNRADELPLVAAE
jgi:DNA (cytosine-5)-methyltransferase 1